MTQEFMIANSGVVKSLCIEICRSVIFKLVDRWCYTQIKHTFMHNWFIHVAYDLNFGYWKTSALFSVRREWDWEYLSAKLLVLVWKQSICGTIYRNFPKTEQKLSKRECLVCLDGTQLINDSRHFLCMETEHYQQGNFWTVQNFRKLSKKRECLVLIAGMPLMDWPWAGSSASSNGGEPTPKTQDKCN